MRETHNSALKSVSDVLGSIRTESRLDSRMANCSITNAGSPANVKKIKAVRFRPGLVLALLSK